MAEAVLIGRKAQEMDPLSGGIPSSFYVMIASNINSAWKRLPYSDFVAQVNGIFGDPATPSTNPGTPTNPQIRFLSGAGTYTNFLSALATPITVGATDGVVWAQFNPTTGYWTKHISTQDLANFYNKNSVDANFLSYTIPQGIASDAPLILGIKDKTTNQFNSLLNGSLTGSTFAATAASGNITLSFTDYASEIPGVFYPVKNLIATRTTGSDTYMYYLSFVSDVTANNKISYSVWLNKAEMGNLMACHFFWTTASGTTYQQIAINTNSVHILNFNGTASSILEAQIAEISSDTNWFRLVIKGDISGVSARTSGIRLLYYPSSSGVSEGIRTAGAADTSAIVTGNNYRAIGSVTVAGFTDITPAKKVTMLPVSLLPQSASLPINAATLDDAMSVVAVNAVQTVNQFPEFDTNATLFNSTFQISLASGVTSNFQAYANDVSGVFFTNKIALTRNSGASLYLCSIGFPSGASGNKLSYSVWVNTTDFGSKIDTHFGAVIDGVTKFNQIVISTSSVHKLTGTVNGWVIETQIAEIRGTWVRLVVKADLTGATGVITGLGCLFYPVASGTTEGLKTTQTTVATSLVTSTPYTLLGLVAVTDYADINPYPPTYKGVPVGQLAGIKPIVTLQNILTYKGSVLQLFKDSFILSEYYRKYAIEMYLTTDQTLGKNLPRYFQFDTTSAAVKTYFLQCNVYDDNTRLLSSKQVSIIVKDPVAPGSKKNVLLVGDSLMAGLVNNSGVTPDSTYPNIKISQEFRRIVRSSDVATSTAPAGLGFTNVELIGTNNAPDRHEGYGGWGWTNFLSSSSPFYKSGAIDWNLYLAQDAIYNDTTNKGVDYIYIGLCLNDIATLTPTIVNGKLTYDVSSVIANAKTFLRTINTQIVQGGGTYAKSTCKVILWCEPFAAGHGGFAYHPSGSLQYNQKLIANIARQTLYDAYYALALDSEFSPFVSVMYATAHMDTENSYPWINKQVNKRSAITEKVDLEDVHPSGGYVMLGEALANDFVYRIS